MPPPLIDAFGRIADDLRVSVTDRCNLRCAYCMPSEGMQWLPRSEILSYEEIDRLVGLFLSLGVRTVRLTGGEPLARRDLQVLVSMLSARGVPDLSLTTNGVLLAEQASALAAAGLQRVNVSVDSLLRHRFASMTRRDALDKVMAGLRAAEAAGLSPIKLNCVVMRATNDDEVVDFARFARETGYEVRFIEFMPLDEQQAWTREAVVPSAEVLARINSVYPVVPVEHGPEPAVLWRFADGAPGAVGVIASVTEPFCSSCNRIRVTTDGQFRTCLFALEETDLRALLRNGSSDDEIADVVRAAVAGKWAGHKINDEDFERPARSMSRFGGKTPPAGRFATGGQASPSNTICAAVSVDSR
jgi:cyclic pyranopterin phosphate synthase